MHTILRVMRTATGVCELGKIVAVAVAALSMIIAPGVTASDIRIRLSYKIILNPNGGTRPPLATDSRIGDGIDAMNILLTNTWRGLRVTHEIVEIGGDGDFEGPSFFYDADLSDNSTKDMLEMLAKLQPSVYLWRNSALNIYVNNVDFGGKSSMPSDGTEMMVVGAPSLTSGSLQLHEIGHYFGLCHTQGCECGHCGQPYINACDCGGQTCVSQNPGVCNWVPGDDGIFDSLEDLPCWDRDVIAAHNFFGLDYGQLPSALQMKVDQAVNNLMAYHHVAPMCIDGNYLSEGQMDMWADVTDEVRRPVVSGGSWFVAEDGCLWCPGTAGAPFNMLMLAVQSANENGGDVIYLRSGSYNEVFVIDRPVVLRATRDGGAAIGASN